MDYSITAGLLKQKHAIVQYEKQNILCNISKHSASYCQNGTKQLWFYTDISGWIQQ